MKSIRFIPAAVLFAAVAFAEPVKVHALNFARAESDTYFAKFVKESGGLSKFAHIRVPTPIEKQDVIRMQRDTLYSSAVFDLDAGPVTITLPDTGKRFLSLLVVNEDHYAPAVRYAPGSFEFTRESVGTRYFAALIRTFVNDPADVKAAQAAQDAIVVKQAGPGTFEIPEWDPATLEKTRNLLLELSALGGSSPNRFGTKDEVEPISWLLASAAGWGGNPPAAAVYFPGLPEKSDGSTAYRMTLKDVPVDGFWSVTVYDAKGFMFENPQKAYSVNNVTAKPAADGSVTIQFGGDPAGADNFLAITPGWNYLLRLYRPRKEVLDGTWKEPALVPVP
jgi:hypothetical protein